MKVNPSAGYEQYKTYVQKLKKEDGSAAKGTSAAKGAAAANTDKVTISGDGVARAELGRVAAAMSAEVENMAGADRLAALKEAVDSGTYSVSSAALADAILGYDE